MNYLLKLSYKNIQRQKKRSRSLGLNYLFIALLLVLVFSFTEGVKVNFTTNLIQSAAGHITISGETVVKGKTTVGISDLDLLTKTVMETFGKEAKTVVRYRVSSTLYNSGDSKTLGLLGIKTENDTALRDQISINDGSYASFESNPQGTLISKNTANYLNLKVGDDVVVSTRTKYGAFNTTTINIAGIYESSNYFIQDLVIGHFDQFQALDLAAKDTATLVYVFFPQLEKLDERRDLLLSNLVKAGFKADKPANATEAIAAVASASPQFKALDPSVSEKRLKVATAFEVLGVLNLVLAGVNGIAIFLAIILFFVTAVSIFINMRMTINDRMKEIGTLRAIGAEKKVVIGGLVLENAILSIIYSIIGIGVGMLLIILIGNVFKLPPEGLLSIFLDQGHLVFAPRIPSLLLIISVILVFTVLCTYIPARRAGKINPALALGSTF